MKIIECIDGYIVRGIDDEELLVAARAHVADAHPDLVGTLTDEDLLGMAKVEEVAR